MPAVDPERQFQDLGAIASIDPARQYLNAKAKHDSAEQTIASLISRLDEVTSALRKDPGSISVTNVKDSVTAEAAADGYNLDGNEWPSAQKIAETLAALNQARQEATKAWAGISEAERSKLPPLPTSG